MNYAVKSFLFWVLSFFMMAAAAVYQHSTGPTYPVSGTVVIGSEKVNYRLIRTWEGDTDAQVKVKVENPEIIGKYRFRRFKSYDEWSEQIPMQQNGNELVAHLPNLPPAGKMMYEIYLGTEGNLVKLTTDPPVLRYKGIVPGWVLIPHIIIIFTAMMFSTRTGFEALTKGKNLKKYATWTVILFGIGGMIFGPLIQKFAFGELWTGWPLGSDLTDNKSLATFIIWVIAWLQVRKDERRRGWVIVASLALIATFVIPHSMMGSEIDFTDPATHQVR